ncbi:MAG: fibronectin [Actinobacteria bacterium]|uniref:Unannotated protein n=1 Tax=freshwater metagenome TaxID=449393 RepID=A0A6J6EL73_9ZZZZ|nr:fibronectin [Actinomycetota bacterium]
MRGRKFTIRALSLLIISSLLSSLSIAVEAQAITPFLQREATHWGHTLAGPSTTSEQLPRQKVVNLEAKSKFVINYKNFPAWAKRDFQAAADVWASHFASSTPITIDASWVQIGAANVLGSARPGSYFIGFEGAPDSTLWYPSALANALAGKDLDKKQAEMIIQVNSEAYWNTRNDGLSYSQEYDLQSVFLHEMAHGLGFLSTDSYDPIFGFGRIEEPTPFDAYALVEDGRRLSDLPSPSIELGLALRSPLVWSGALGVAANGGVRPLLFTPKEYEEGSSVSHLDEDTFSKSGENAVMTPNLEAGEIFHKPGPLLLAMMEDMRLKPPAGKSTGIPLPVRNLEALISDSEAIISFDPPANARTAQISTYTVRNNVTNQVKNSIKSPVKFTGLKNGSAYTFTVIATNINGSSEPVTTASIVPAPSWKRFVIDAKSDAKLLSSVTFNGEPAIVYADSKSGDLRIAQWNSKAWIKRTIDGAGGSQGRTNLPITGALSTCVNGIGKKQTLHIFYADEVDKDLRYAKYDGKNFTYEIVDGNGPQVNSYEAPIRVRTASDVNVTSACIASAGGVQVFYRDESQGILLGAVKGKSAKSWSYELVDGDRKTDGRTTGDVAFSLKAIFDGRTSYLIYDAVLDINQKEQATASEIRIATRTNFSPTSWSYRILESSTPVNPVSGFALAVGKSIGGVFATWLGGDSLSLPEAKSIRWLSLSTNTEVGSVIPEGLGTPSRYLSTDTSLIAFTCERRLCAIDKSKSIPKKIFVSPYENPDGIESAWVNVNRAKFLVAGIYGQLVMLRP